LGMHVGAYNTSMALITAHEAPQRRDDSRRHHTRDCTNMMWSKHMQSPVTDTLLGTPAV
jgi:hypothetical protein